MCFDFLSNQIDSIFPTVCSILDPKIWLQCGYYFHYQITNKTKSSQLLRQCPSLVPSPRYFGRRFLFGSRGPWEVRCLCDLKGLGITVYGLTTNYFPGFCDIDCHRFQTNKRTTNSKMLRRKAKQNKRTTATKMDNGHLTLYVSDSFQCDLSKLLTVWEDACPIKVAVEI